MNKKRILLIEDEQDMVYAVKLQLESEGYEVLSAFDGWEGLNKAQSVNPDIIILDVLLPKLDGYEVCRKLKFEFDQKYKKIPIVLFTVRSQPRDEKMGYEVGADGYISKPFEARLLLSEIVRLIGKAE